MGHHDRDRPPELRWLAGNLAWHAQLATRRAEFDVRVAPDAPTATLRAIAPPPPRALAPVRRPRVDRVA